MPTTPASQPRTLSSPTQNAPDGTTLVITERVRPDQVSAYEIWARRLHEELAQQPGFLGVNVLRDPAQATPEYITLLRFESQQALEQWRQSAVYRTALQELPQFTAAAVSYHETRGLDAWFDRPTTPVQAPPLWKNIVVGFIGVYPLILLFSKLFAPITQHWVWWAAIIPSAFFATVFLNWPVLPLLSRGLRRWLYPEK